MSDTWKAELNCALECLQEAGLIEFYITDNGKLHFRRTAKGKADPQLIMDALKTPSVANTLYGEGELAPYLWRLPRSQPK